MFRRALIEVTNVCNLRCPFCAVSSRKPCFMEPGLFEKAARQAGELAQVLSLHLLGEPFMHPRLPELLATLSRLGLKLNLVTNGTLLGKFGPALFRERCLEQVTVSLQALAALPEGERPAALVRAVAFAKERPENVIASYRLRCGTGDALYALAKEAFTVAFPGWKDRGRGALELAEGVFLNTGPLFDWRGGRETGKGCLGLRHHFGILCGGEVVPCCADYDGALALGNIKDRPLREILTSPEARAMRSAIASGTAMPEYCRGCGFTQPG